MSVRRDTSGPAQALEFAIWAVLIRQSHGLLHPFLPLLDRGLDAVLHHMTDGRYIPIQVKGRSWLSWAAAVKSDRGSADGFSTEFRLAAAQICRAGRRRRGST